MKPVEIVFAAMNIPLKVVGAGIDSQCHSYQIQVQTNNGRPMLVGCEFCLPCSSSEEVHGIE